MTDPNWDDWPRDRYTGDPLIEARKTHKPRAEMCGHPDGRCCVECTTDERHVAWPCPAVNEGRCGFTWAEYRCIQHVSHVSRDGERHLVESPWRTRMVVAAVCEARSPKSTDIRDACLMDPGHELPHSNGTQEWT